MNNVIITGANGSLGQAVTRSFLNQGYNVIAIVKKEADLKAMPVHEHLHTEVMDLTRESETAALIQQLIRKYEKIEAALLLAGGFTMGNLQQTKGADIQQQITLNFETAYHVAQPLLQHMQQQAYGRLVFIGARTALEAADGKTKVAYALSKSLLFQLANLINATTQGTNVTATVMVPSLINTADNRASMPDADPAGWVEPEALADIIQFVCSEKAHALRETVLKVYNNL